MKLNLAAGNRVEVGPEWVNHDRWIHRPEITVAHDLRVMPWPWTDSTFEVVRAFDVIEHMQDIVAFIEEMWRVSKDGADVYVHTAWAGPSVHSRHVWRDPQHTRPLHEDTFAYFDPVGGGYWHENYGKFYSPARFQVIDVDLEPPDCIGFKLKALK